MNARIEAVGPGRPPTLEEARDQVRPDWENRRRLDTIDQLYERLRDQYTISVEPLSAPESGT